LWTTIVFATMLVMTGERDEDDATTALLDRVPL
jgi:hypothetical protein